MSGPAPGARCGVCNSPVRASIERDDRNEVSRREIARRYGLGKDAVSRHFTNGHAVALPVAPLAGSATGTAAASTSPVGMLRHALEELRSMDTSEMSPAAQTSRLDAIRRSAESLGKLEPPQRHEVVSVDDFLKTVIGEGGTTFAQLLETWFRGLEPFPEAREAMIEAARDAGLQPRPDRADVHYWSKIYPKYHGGEEPPEEEKQ